MARKASVRKDPSCSCAMLTLYRFVEPLTLFMLKKNGPAHGYDLLSQICHHVLTDKPIDGPALYRTLRILEANGHVTSSWKAGEAGPARRQYSLTAKGEHHLTEWREVLARLHLQLQRFTTEIGDLVPDSPCAAESRSCSSTHHHQRSVTP